MFERLHPGGPAARPEELLAELHRRRPGLFLDMVATIDGRAAVGGRSGPIGGEGDQEMFHLLREVPDAVLIGAGTLRAEKYGRLVRSPERRARRAAAGLAEDPIAVLVTRSGNLPWDAPIFTAPEQRVLVFGPVQPPSSVTAQISVMPYADPAHVLVRLRDTGVESVLCEGGPTLNRSLLEAEVVDELFLTVGPLLAGGDEEPGIVAGPALPAPAAAELRWVLRCQNELFLRYGLPAPPAR